MGYLIVFFAVGSIAIELTGLGLRNETLVLLGVVLFIVYLTLCVLDAYIAASRGVKGNHVFNWVVSSRYEKKLKK
jgi:hypothetical protein